MTRAVAPACRSGVQHWMIDSEVPVDWSCSMPSGAAGSTAKPYTAGSGGAASRVVAARSTSSSSAISIGREVKTPCPISTLGMTKVMRLLGSIRTKALSASCAAGAAALPDWRCRSATPTTSAPATAAPVSTKRRRVMRSGVLTAVSHLIDAGEPAACERLPCASRSALVGACAARRRPRRLQQYRGQLGAQLRQREAAGGRRYIDGGERLTSLAEHGGGDGHVTAVALLVGPGVTGLAGRLDALPDLAHVGERRGGERAQ